jgi:intracellular septation protein A
MKRILALLGFAYESFAPLVVFLVAERLFGLKVAIGAALAFGVVDLAGRLARRRAITRLYVFSFAVTLAFGAIDLYATTPFVFAYEASITNALTAGFFGVTLLRGTPLIQEIAERGLSSQQAARADVRGYLRVLTMVWTGYFVGKAAFYAYLAARLPIDRAIAIRSAFGTASMAALLLGEPIVRRRLFAALQKRGLIPPAPAPEAAVQATTPTAAAAD